jgi:hypothetical protein
MLELKTKKSKNEIHVGMKQSHKKENSEEYHYHIKEIFVGHRTIISVIGFTVGGILVGRTIWEYSREYLGLPLTLMLGLALFAVSGLVSGQFRKIKK